MTSTSDDRPADHTPRRPKDADATAPDEESVTRRPPRRRTPIATEAHADAVESACHELEVIARITAGQRAILAQAPPTKNNRLEHLRRQLAAEYVARFGARADSLQAPVDRLCATVGALFRADRREEITFPDGVGALELLSAAYQAIRECRHELHQFWADLETAMADHFGTLSISPAELYQTRGAVDAAWVGPDRIYADLTNVTFRQIQELWPHIELRQELLRARGLSGKRGRGQHGPRTEALRWQLRVREVGFEIAHREFKEDWDKTAHREFKEDCEAAPRSAWVERAEWWQRRVRDPLRNQELPP
jgi:hypothetical protein